MGKNQQKWKRIVSELYLGHSLSSVSAGASPLTSSWEPLRSRTSEVSKCLSLPLCVKEPYSIFGCCWTVYSQVNPNLYLLMLCYIVPFCRRFLCNAFFILENVCCECLWICPTLLLSLVVLDKKKKKTPVKSDVKTEQGRAQMK